jgi:hypothetical protein
MVTAAPQKLGVCLIMEQDILQLLRGRDARVVQAFPQGVSLV